MTANPAAAAPPLPRPAVADLPAYRPGRSAEVAMADHGIASAIKLASNESPFDPLPSVMKAIEVAGFAALHRYADHRAVALREQLAARFGVPTENVTVGCGSVGLLQQILLAYADPGDEVIYGWRSFEAYPVYTRTVGATAVEIALRAEHLDMAAITAAVTPRTKIVLLASPNNPSGTIVTHDELVTLLDAAPNTLVVFDAAYDEYVTDPRSPRALELLARYPNLAVLRTFSKAYGLAALRVGYLLSDPVTVANIDKVLVPFAVNGLGQAAALASLEDRARGELLGRVEQSVAERLRLEAALRTRGFDLTDSQGNFVWLPARDSAADLALALEREGVVTRPFAGDGVRVTIGTPAENDRFLAAFDRCASDVALADHWAAPVR